MPRSHIEFGKTWEENHPGWIVKFWRDPEELPETELSHVYKKLDNIIIAKSVAKSELMRIDIIHYFGGVYVDTDFECVKNLGPLISGTKAFVGATSRGRRSWICDAIFGAQPGHPWMRAVVEMLLQRDRNKIEPIQPMLIGFFGRLAKKYNVDIFKDKFFYPYHRHEKKNYEQAPEKFINSDTYAMHHWHESWAPKSHAKA